MFETAKAELENDKPQTVSTTLYNPTVVVIGGTSGVGLALAKKHLQLGWQVIVVGSQHNKIVALQTNNAPELKRLEAIQCDVTNPIQLNELFIKLKSKDFIRVIYSAGWYLNERVHQLNKTDSEHMLAVNLQSFNTIFAWASEQLKTRTQSNKATSQLLKTNSQQSANVYLPALICLSSIAGIVDYPYTSLYARCKRAMIATASAYRTALVPFGIQVNCIAMGYVDTQTLRDLNDGDASHKPFIIDESIAVAKIMQAIENNKALSIFPSKMRHITAVLNKLPKFMLNWAMRRQLDERNF